MRSSEKKVATDHGTRQESARQLDSRKRPSDPAATAAHRSITNAPTQDARQYRTHLPERKLLPSGPLTASDVFEEALAEAGHSSDDDTTSNQSRSCTVPDVEPLDLEKEIRKLRKELSEERLEHEVTRSLLQTAREELQTASFFLEQTDSITHAQVAELAEDLNYHIFELSAQISDALALQKWSRKNERQYTSRVNGARMGLMYRRKAVGKDFFQFVPLGFEKENLPRRLMLLEYVAQSWLVIFCFKLLQRSRWSTDQTEERVLSQLYERLVNGEPNQKAFAGRWRTLTREACKSIQLDENALADEITSGMHTVLTAFEFHFLHAPALAFLSNFRGSITCIVRTVLELDRATKEKVSTVEMHAMMGEPGQRYPSAFLEDGANSVGATQAKKRDKVLLSTGLGLTMTRRSEVNPEPKCLLKAKVVLYTAVNS